MSKQQRKIKHASVPRSFWHNFFAAKMRFVLFSAFLLKGTKYSDRNYHIQLDMLSADLLRIYSTHL